MSQCNYSWELCLLFSDYSPKLEDTYYSQIIPGIICQSLIPSAHDIWRLCKDGTGRELRCLYDTVQKHLKAMEYEPSGPFVTSILELKLDTKLIQCLNGRSRVKVQPQLVLYLNELLEFINLRAQASEGSTSDQGKRFPEGKSHHPRRSLVAGKPVPIVRN